MDVYHCFQNREEIALSSDYELKKEIMADFLKFIQRIEVLMKQMDGLPDVESNTLRDYVISVLARKYRVRPFFTLRLPGCMQALNTEGEKIDEKIASLLAKEKRTKGEDQDLAELQQQEELVESQIVDWMHGLPSKNKELQKAIGGRGYFAVIGRKWELKFFEAKYRTCFLVDLE